MSEAIDYEALADEIRAEVLMLSQGVPSSTATYDLLRRTGAALRQAAQDGMFFSKRATEDKVRIKELDRRIRAWRKQVDDLLHLRQYRDQQAENLQDRNEALERVVEAATNFVMASDVGDPGQIASCAGYLEQVVLARIEEETDE